jgi:hypothetical protein
MQKWEYLYITAYQNDVRYINEKSIKLVRNSLPGYLKQLGEIGWELVSTNGLGESLVNLFVFKRPLE